MSRADDLNTISADAYANGRLLTKQIGRWFARRWTPTPICLFKVMQWSDYAEKYVGPVLWIRFCETVKYGRIQSKYNIWLNSKEEVQDLIDKLQRALKDWDSTSTGEKEAIDIEPPSGVE